MVMPVSPNLGVCAALLNTVSFWRIGRVPGFPSGVLYLEGLSARTFKTESENHVVVRARA